MKHFNIIFSKKNADKLNLTDDNYRTYSREQVLGGEEEENMKRIVSGKYDESLRENLDSSVDVYLKFHHSIPFPVLAKICDKYGVNPDSFAPMQSAPDDKRSLEQIQAERKKKE